MKTALISFLTASLLVVASFASGHAFSAPDLITVLFTAGLVAWTIEQYSRETRSLMTSRPIGFPTKTSSSPVRPTVALRLAA